MSERDAENVYNFYIVLKLAAAEKMLKNAFYFI